MVGEVEAAWRVRRPVRDGGGLGGVGGVGLLLEGGETGRVVIELVVEGIGGVCTGGGTAVAVDGEREKKNEENGRTDGDTDNYGGGEA